MTCTYSPTCEHEYNPRNVCVWCGEYATRRMELSWADLPEGLVIDRHPGKCHGRIVLMDTGARCKGCGKRFEVGVIVQYWEAKRDQAIV